MDDNLRGENNNANSTDVLPNFLEQYSLTSLTSAKVRDDALDDADCALTVRDVSELLYAQYAIISGGKGPTGCPILTFPDRGNFHQISDEEYRKLIIYLTSVPSLQDADYGFVLVIDRRSDKWNSVKAVLLKISVFFPGLINVAYVLRPSGFFQKAISEVSSKIFRDEFKFRVIVCNYVQDVHEYIDRNQLTEDLDGCIPYNHEEWIQQRVAVEKFSSNTQDISGALRNFTDKLQDTEFPNDVASCQELLNSQITEYNDLKQELLQASGHGENLLGCIKNDPDTQSNMEHTLCPDKLINVTAVERLLVQLEETEKTFDNFWERHHDRLKQCLMLRRFQTEFKELQPLLEADLQELYEMNGVGDSVSRVDYLLAQTQRFHQDCSEHLTTAESLHQSGSRLIASQHYALDSIQPKCVELLRMKDSFDSVINKRFRILKTCREFFERIEEINRWCTQGVELLTNQQIDRYQAPEFAEEALHEHDLFMRSSAVSSDSYVEEIKRMLDDIGAPQLNGLVQQVLKRLEDVQLMCEKRKNSLTKMATRPSRPVQVVPPEAAIPLHLPQHSQGNSTPHSHPSSPLQPESLSSMSSPKIMRNGSITPKLGVDLSSPDHIIDPEVARARRSHVLNELHETERVYVLELCSVLKGYKDEMLNPDFQPQIPINLYGKSDILFGNMEEIFRFHNDIFLRDLENCIGTPELIGLCFVQRKDTFHHLYSFYCQNKPQSEELRRQVGDNNSFFKECQQRLEHKLPLSAYLLKPVQRITKYQLLLKDLLKCVEGNQGRWELQEAVDTMLTVLKCLNDSMHQVSIQGFPGNLSEVGRLLMQGPFSVYTESKKGLRDLRLKPAQRHLFLYEKILLFTKRAGKEMDRETYHYKNALKMSQIGLTESVRGNKGDLKKFEVWLQARQEVYTIVAMTQDIKELWVKEIKRVLLDQFEFLKGEKIKQYTSRGMQKGSSLNGTRVQPLSPTQQHRSLRQTASWDICGSISSSSSDSGKTDGIRSKTSNSKSSDGRNDSQLDAPEEEEESWSSEYSPSDEEEDHETFGEIQEIGTSRFLVLADYNAMGSSEVSLRDGTYVDLIKVGCAGWWYVRSTMPTLEQSQIGGSSLDNCAQTSQEGWAPAAYLERVKKGTKSSPSVSSQEEGIVTISPSIRHATSRSSVASSTSKNEDIN